MDMNRKLYRSNTNRMICGVCGGIGEYLNAVSYTHLDVYKRQVLYKGAAVEAQCAARWLENAAAEGR